MIALITSTIYPLETYSYFNGNERYEQTITTIKELVKKGFKDIYMFDNSKILLDSNSIKSDSKHDVQIFHSSQYSFKNKGLNEALLILNNIHNLPDNTSIFKISGRYFPTLSFNVPEIQDFAGKEFLGKGYNFLDRSGTFSTRAYCSINKRVLEEMLVLCVDEMISYSKGINGLRSAINSICASFTSKIGTEYQISIEQAFARILKSKRNYHLVNNLNIQGLLAGSKYLELISE